MAIYLDEQFLGCDQNTIGFPHLLLCMGFVVIVKNPATQENILWGIHLTDPESSQRTFGLFADSMFEQVNPLHIKMIYGSCNRLLRYGTTEESVWKNEMMQFARALNFKGPARGFDTSIIQPRDGTYVQYDLVQPDANRCEIYYRQHDKMNYSESDDTAPLGQKVVFSDTDITQLPLALQNNPKVIAKTRDRVEDAAFSTSGATPFKRLLGKASLTEVDYAQRLTEVYVY